MRCVRIALLAFLIVASSFWGYLYTHYQVPILMYHSLDKTRVKEYAAVDPDVFYQQMKFIKDHHYKVVSLSDYCRQLQANQPIAHNLVVITFDDGAKDNLKAVEVLKDFDFSATIFIIVDDIGTPGYLSQEEISGFLKDTKVGIGSHTMSHAYLPETDSDAALTKEILGSKEALQQSFGKNVDVFSYPAGGFDQRALRKVSEAGFLCACTTNRGFSRKQDRFALRRIKITNRDKGFLLWAKLSGFYDLFKKVKKPN